MLCRALYLVVALASLNGCLSPLAMHRAVLEYDKTVNLVEAEMLLLNIAHAKHGQALRFTVVSNVAWTFDFRSSGGAGGQLFETSGPVFARNFYMFNLGASVAENPTVSIIPVQGEDLTKRILTPMDEAKFDFLVAQGIEPAIESDSDRTFFSICRIERKNIGSSGKGFSTCLD